MPDSKPVSLPRIAGLALAALGGAGMIAAALVAWFTVTAKLPDLGIAGLPSEVRAEVTGIGGVSAPAVNGIDVSSNVPVRAAWAGYAVIALGALALAAAVAAFTRRGLRIPGGTLALIAGLAGGGIAGYALATATGSQTAKLQGITLEVTTTAAAGPYVTIAGAAATALGALVLLLVRPVPVGPQPLAPQTQPQPPAPQAQPQPPASQPVRRPVPQSGWARPAAPDEHLDTVHSPVAHRRPQPEWDRNWPGMLPSPPAPPTPSQQETRVVKRPPRPVRVSPNPETRVIPRQQPQNYDGPTEPL